MYFITGTGIDWVLAVQSLGGWLELPMRFLTFLGSEDFFFIILPLIYWSIDAKVGLQVGLILATNNFINSVCKLLFASPRPYWVSDQVRPVVGESSFGSPSGHAQNAAAIWGIMAHGIHRRRAWVAASILVFLIGFSRPNLGVHFVQDVLLGWLLGGIVLVLFTRLWEPAARWIGAMTLARQVGLAFVIAVLMVLVGGWLVAGLDGFVIPQEWLDNARPTGVEPDPVSLEGFITTAGSFFGLAAGAAWIVSRGGYHTAGPPGKARHALRGRRARGPDPVDGAWAGLSGRCKLALLFSAFPAVYTGRLLGDRWSALVVFSFQIGGRAQDVGNPSVIIPNLR